MGDGCGEGGLGGSWSRGRGCGTGGTSLSSDVEGGLAEGGSDLVSVGFLLDLRVSRVNRLSFLNPLTASEIRSTRAWRSSMAFVTPPFGESLVRVGITSGCVESKASASGGGEV